MSSIVKFKFFNKLLFGISSIILENLRYPHRVPWLGVAIQITFSILFGSFLKEFETHLATIPPLECPTKITLFKSLFLIYFLTIRVSLFMGLL